MLQRCQVVYGKMNGFPDAARWIETHPRDYAEGVFRGFEAEEGGGR